MELVFRNSSNDQICRRSTTFADRDVANGRSEDQFKEGGTEICSFLISLKSLQKSSPIRRQIFFDNVEDYFVCSSGGQEL